VVILLEKHPSQKFVRAYVEARTASCVLHR
jgi:hypothetical protein